MTEQRNVKEEKKAVHTCTKQSLYISISASPRNKRRCWQWHGRICHQVMNEPVRLETVWSCPLIPGLITLIESGAATREQTYVARYNLVPLFVCFHFSLRTVITIDGAAEEQHSRNNSENKLLMKNLLSLKHVVVEKSNNFAADRISLIWGEYLVTFAPPVRDASFG